MIASPGDVAEERGLAREVIAAWNASHSISTNLILNAVGWEDAPADLGGRPQQLINDRLLKECDLLVGIFWTRLGTPTGGFESGTVEEIQTHLAAGKPAMVYFSEKTIAPSKIDKNQHDGVLLFKEWCLTKGIVWTYNSAEDFRWLFSKNLQTQLNSNRHLVNIKNSSLADLIYPPTLRTAPPPPPISGDAEELLHHAASDRNGMIIISDAITGRSLDTNQKEFGAEDSRSWARWKAALDELAKAKLIERDGDQMFKVTDKGYKSAR